MLPVHTAHHSSGNIFSERPETPKIIPILKSNSNLRFVTFTCWPRMFPVLFLSFSLYASLIWFSQSYLQRFYICVMRCLADQNRFSNIDKKANGFGVACVCLCVCLSFLDMVELELRFCQRRWHAGDNNNNNNNNADDDDGDKAQCHCYLRKLYLYSNFPNLQNSRFWIIWILFLHTHTTR